MLITAIVLLQYFKQGCTNTNRQLTKHAHKKPLHVTSLAAQGTQMARGHRLQPTFSHPAATSVNHHNRIPSFQLLEQVYHKKKKQTLAKSCPVHCQQDAHQPQHQPFFNWIRSNVGDTAIRLLWTGPQSLQANSPRPHSLYPRGGWSFQLSLARCIRKKPLMLAAGYLVGFRRAKK